MGYGANLSIKNISNVDITVTVPYQSCMYDNGDDGSYLCNYDNLVIPASTNYPATGSTYIEAKASGDCFFTPSYFNINIMGGGYMDGGVTCYFTETDDSYTCQCDIAFVDAYISPAGSTDTIVITVGNPWY